MVRILHRVVHLPADKIKKLLGIGVIVGLHWLCFFGSIKFASVSIALVTLSAAGFFSALFEPLITKKKLDGVELFLGIVCILGIYVIFSVDSSNSIGIGLGLASAALSSLFSILNKKIIAPGLSGFAITFWEMWGALAIVSVSSLLFYIKDPFPFLPLPLDWFWIALLAFLCTIWPWFLQLQSLRHLSASTVNLSYNLEPVYGILMAVVLFHENEQMGASFLVGALIIGISVGIQTWRVMQKEKSRIRLNLE